MSKTGFTTHDDTILSLVENVNDVNDTFSVTISGNNFKVWVAGTELTKNTETITKVGSASTKYYIFYNTSGVLTISEVSPETDPVTFAGEAMVCTVLWDCVHHYGILEEARYFTWYDFADRYKEKLTTGATCLSIKNKNGYNKVFSKGIIYDQLGSRRYNSFYYHTDGTLIWQKISSESPSGSTFPIDANGQPLYVIDNSSYPVPPDNYFRVFLYVTNAYNPDAEHPQYATVCIRETSTTNYLLMNFPSIPDYLTEGWKLISVSYYYLRLENEVFYDDRKELIYCAESVPAPNGKIKNITVDASNVYSKHTYHTGRFPNFDAKNTYYSLSSAIGALEQKEAFSHIKHDLNKSIHQYGINDGNYFISGGELTPWTQYLEYFYLQLAYMSGEEVAENTLGPAVKPVTYLMDGEVKTTPPYPTNGGNPPRQGYYYIQDNTIKFSTKGFPNDCEKYMPLYRINYDHIVDNEGNIIPGDIRVHIQQDFRRRIYDYTSTNLAINGNCKVAQEYGDTEVSHTTGPIRIADMAGCLGNTVGATLNSKRGSDGSNTVGKYYIKQYVAIAGSRPYANNTYIGGFFWNIPHKDLNISGDYIYIRFKWAAGMVGKYAVVVRNGTLTDSCIMEFDYLKSHTLQLVGIKMPLLNSLIEGTNGRGLRIIIGAIGTGTYQTTIPSGEKYKYANDSYYLSTTNCVDWTDGNSEWSNYIAMSDLEVSFNHLPFFTNEETYGETLAKCQRYNQVLHPTANYRLLGHGVMMEPNKARILIPTIVPMEGIPTLTMPSLTNVKIYTAGQGYTPTAFTVVAKENNGVTVDFTIAGGNWANPCILYTQGKVQLSCLM